jgi:hypothetical protein
MEPYLRSLPSECGNVIHRNTDSLFFASQIGQKRAREMWFLARFYSAQEAMNMGLINTVVPLEKLEEETVVWCRKILQNSPMAIRLLKSALNAVEDGHAGLQELAGNATLLFYGSDEAIEGKTAYLEGRKPDFSKFPRLPWRVRIKPLDESQSTWLLKNWDKKFTKDYVPLFQWINAGI